MRGDRAHTRTGVARRLALTALVSVGERVLKGGFTDRHALQSGGQTRVVHHREHAGKAAIFLADEVADGPALVAVDHGAGGRTVNAELMLEARAKHVIARAERAVLIDQEFRRDKQRDAARAGWRVGQTGEHEMNDVVAHVVFAVGDEDLLAENPIGAVGRPLGLRCAGR